LTFFGLALVAICLPRLKRAFVPLQVGALCAGILIWCLAAGGVPSQLYSPPRSALAVFDDVRGLVQPSRFAQAQAVAREQFLSTGDSLSAPVLALLEGHTVAVEPTEDAINWVYPQLRWDPEPVLQGFSAYTPYLDKLNAAFLASSRAPQRILYQPWQVIDGRYEFLDPPATLESMYCHYAQLAVAGPEQVLERVKDRCGRAKMIGHAEAHFGQVITVPQVPGKMVVASFSLSSPLAAKIEGALLKPPQVAITIWADGPAPATYRYIPGTSQDENVLSVPSALGYAAPFSPPTVHRLSFSGGGWATGQGDVKVTFYAVNLWPS
jgi:hypothetical protein